jgi:hypothetical protein
MQPTLRQLYNLGPDDSVIHKLWPAGSHPIDLRCYNYATMVRRGYIAPGTALRPHSTLGRFSPSSWTPFAPYTLQTLHQAILHDGYHPLPTTGPLPQAPEDHLLLAAFMKLPDIPKQTRRPSRKLTPEDLTDIHFLRHHPHHGFSHKWGDDKVMFTDLSGNPITDPRTANLGTFQHFVGFYHAPIDGLPNHTRTDFIDNPAR